MPRTKLYYTLLVRDNKQSPWAIHFGDYDRSVVNQERSDFIDQLWDDMGKRLNKNNTLIISTGDKQADIQARVDELNAALIFQKDHGDTDKKMRPK